jgi:hypothetical protein
MIEGSTRSLIAFRGGVLDTAPSNHWRSIIVLTQYN